MSLPFTPRLLRLLPLAVLSLLLAACGGTRDAAAPSGRAPGTGAMARAPEPVAALPDVPRAEGPVDIHLAYPRLGARRPDADSTFLFGRVGTGSARLTVNGIRVPVDANGAFLAFLPVNETYRLTATAGTEADTLTFRYNRPVSAEDAVPMAPRAARVISGRDTLAGASEIVAGRAVPGGDRGWFFPRGTRLTVDATLPGLARVRLTKHTTAWVARDALDLGGPAPATGSIGPVRTVASPRTVDVRIPVDFAPFSVTAEAEAVGLTVYGRRPATQSVSIGGDGLIQGARWTSVAADSSRLFLALERPLWGYKAFYTNDGTLVLRLRRPPRVPASAPLDGLHVMLDPGHPPGGAIGPTGLTEAEANLAIARRVAARLRGRGATVSFTRDSSAPLENASWPPDELWARVDRAVYSNADVLVSIHNNAFPDGTNPFDGVGSETYYFHPFAQALAQEMVDSIAPITGLRNKGAHRRSLALVRPTWMPAVLTESLYMMFPQQEAALRDPAFLDRLAEAHVRGLVRFVGARR